MRILTIIGVILLGLGLLGLIYGGITYTKDTDTADLGPLEVSVHEQGHLQIHPVLGGVVLAAGVGVLAVAYGSRRRRS